MHRATIAVALLIAGCGSAEQKPSAPAETPAPARTAAPATTAAPAALVGRWERQQTCGELVSALERNDLAALAPGVATDFFPDAKPAQLAKRDDVCQGAARRPHSHFFTADGAFGSVDDRNQQVDDGAYELSGEHGLRIGGKEFRYTISHGDTLVMHPVISAAARRKGLAHPLEFSDAGWQVAVTYDGLPWKRVDCDGWC
jgi:hypothetical protein